MFVADSTERRMLEDAPLPASYIYSDVLEELTGADLMITNLKAPLVPALLKAHVASGAILVQIKRGHDLAASVGPRMNSSLARMIDCGTFAPWQRVLLYIGTLSHDDSGSAIINGQITQQSFWSVQGALEKWIERGGTVSCLPRAGMVSSWLGIKLAHLKEYEKSPIKHVYKQAPQLTQEVTDEVQGVQLQRLVLIKDWRNTILTLPGLGEKRVEAIYEYVCKHLDGSLLQAFFHLTDESLITEIPGLGMGTARKIRDWFGLDEVMNLSVEVKQGYGEQEE